MRIILDGDPKGEHLWLEHHDDMKHPDDQTVTIGMYMLRNVEAVSQQTNWFDKPLITISTQILLKALNAQRLP